MRYLVDVAGTRVEVELAADGVRVDGALVHAHLADVDGTPVKLLTIDGAVRRVALRRGEGRGRYTLWLDGHRIDAEALDERARAIRELTAASAPKGPGPVVAPMPGLVVRVLIREGEPVHAGQPVVVMEAMKMENELRASGEGTVHLVRVQPGTAVEKGAVLVELI